MFLRKQLIVSSGKLKKLIFPGHWTTIKQMLYWQLNCFQWKLILLRNKTGECQTSTTFIRNLNATGSPNVSCGLNTLRSVDLTMKILSCIHASATTFKRMKRSGVHQCTSIVNPVNRLKSIGLEIRHI